MPYEKNYMRELKSAFPHTTRDSRMAVFSLLSAPLVVGLTQRERFPHWHERLASAAVSTF